MNYIQFANVQFSLGLRIPSVIDYSMFAHAADYFDSVLDSRSLLEVRDGKHASSGLQMGRRTFTLAILAFMMKYFISGDEPGGRSTLSCLKST